MKKALLLTLAFAIVGIAAHAQLDQKDHKKEKGEWENKIKQELKLTDDQTAKYDALNKEYDEKFSTIAQDANLTKEAQKERKMALKKEKETRFFEFLTTEQQAKYKELMDQRKKQMEKPSGTSSN